MATTAPLPAHTFPPGTVLFDEQQVCRGLPIVEEGRVRVFKAFPNGRELLLYHLEPNDRCIVSIGALLSGSRYDARAVAETPVTLRLMSIEQFKASLADPSFCQDLLVRFAQRLSDLMGLVDAISTHRLDQRLAALLIEHGPDCTLTHQELADVLGTVREIVTRLVRQFVEQGLVSSERGHIRIVDGAALNLVATRSN